MRHRAEAMLKIEEIMSPLSELDRNMVAYEVFRTYGDTRITPVGHLIKTPRKHVDKHHAKHVEKHAEKHEVSSANGGGFGGGSVSKAEKQALDAKAIEILEFLNVKTGKSFQSVDENLRFIRARLAKHSVEDIKGVIARKTREWLNTEHAQWLRPKTLFNATNFANYVGEQPRDV